jgi:hypothetical protein
MPSPIRAGVRASCVRIVDDPDHGPEARKDHHARSWEPTPEPGAAGRGRFFVGCHRRVAGAPTE